MRTNRNNWIRRGGAAGAFVCLLVLLPACMTPEKAVRQTDEAARRLAQAYWQAQTGLTNTFDVSRPADALTLRLALIASANAETNIALPRIPAVSPVMTNDEWMISLPDALAVAARNDRHYQTLKETVFNAALDMDYQQFAFETTFSGLLLGALSGSPDNPKATASAEPGASRMFENGSVIAGNLALDVAKLLQNDWQSAGIVGDLTLSVPLLRGSGRDIVREPLTQAERDLLYAIETFAYYRQTYAAAVASDYLNVLLSQRQLLNAIDNAHNLLLNSRRAEMMFRAGRMKNIELAQALSDYYSAQSSVVTRRNTFETRLDAFKVTIGLPPESRICLDAQELNRLTDEISQAALSKQGPGIYGDSDASCALALKRRPDYFIVEGAVADAERKVKVAADALQADLTLVGKGSFADTSVRADGSTESSDAQSWQGRVRLDLPWNRRKERNAYRKKLIALGEARRTLEAKEDAIKKAVRDSIRNLAAAAATYKVQTQALKVAEMRVESNRLFQESGRSTMRDVLEAENALLTARNSYYAAVTSWRVSELELQRDMGILALEPSGRIARPKARGGKKSGQ